MKEIPLISEYDNLLMAYEVISSHLHHNAPEEIVSTFYEFKETFNCPTFRGFTSDKMISKDELISGHSSFSFSLLTAKDFTRLMDNEGQFNFLINASHLTGINIERITQWLIDSALSIKESTKENWVNDQLEIIIEELTTGELHFFSLEEEIVATNPCFLVDEVVVADDIITLKVRG